MFSATVKTKSIWKFNLLLLFYFFFCLGLRQFWEINLHPFRKKKNPEKDFKKLSLKIKLTDKKIREQLGIIKQKIDKLNKKLTKNNLESLLTWNEEENFTVKPKKLLKRSRSEREKEQKYLAELGFNIASLLNSFKIELNLTKLDELKPLRFKKLKWLDIKVFKNILNTLLLNPILRPRHRKTFKTFLKNNTKNLFKITLI